MKTSLKKEMKCKKAAFENRLILSYVQTNNGHTVKENNSQQIQFDLKEVEPAQEAEQSAEAVVQMQQPSESDQVNDAGQAVAKQKSKKKKLMSIGGFVLNIVIVVAILWYQLSNEEVASPDYLFSQGSRLWYLLLIFACFAIVMFLDAFRTNFFVKHSGNRSRPCLSYKTCAIGKYYDAVTPMSTGGQPFQVFYLNNRGLSASAALSVPMARYVVSQMGWMTVSIVAVFCVINFNLADTSLVSVASYVGFALNATILAFTLVLSLSQKIGKKLVVKGLKLLQKMRIVKNYDKQYERVMNIVSGYQTTMASFAKAKWRFIGIVLVSVCMFLVTYSVPFFTYLLFGGTDVSMWPKMIMLTVMIELAASFIPLPGGTGMNEISFTVLFASYFADGTIFWALLIWRFTSYYMYLLQGIGAIIYDYAVGNKKYNWQKRKWELEAESALFKEQQLKMYRKKKREAKNSK